MREVSPIESFEYHDRESVMLITHCCVERSYSKSKVQLKIELFFAFHTTLENINEI